MADDISLKLTTRDFLSVDAYANRYSERERQQECHKNDTPPWFWRKREFGVKA
jgi:hypothetical protein